MQLRHSKLNVLFSWVHVSNAIQMVSIEFDFDWNELCHGMKFNMEWGARAFLVMAIGSLHFNYVENINVYLFAVNVVDGEMLTITKVSRLHMAPYLCVSIVDVSFPIITEAELIWLILCRLHRTEFHRQSANEFYYAYNVRHLYPVHIPRYSIRT